MERKKKKNSESTIRGRQKEKRAKMTGQCLGKRENKQSPFDPFARFWLDGGETASFVGIARSYLTPGIPRYLPLLFRPFSFTLRTTRSLTVLQLVGAAQFKILRPESVEHMCSSDMALRADEPPLPHSRSVVVFSSSLGSPPCSFLLLFLPISVVGLACRALGVYLRLRQGYFVSVFCFLFCESHGV